MKQFMLCLAMVGLAATGCAQNRVIGTHARRGGADMKIVRQQTKPRSNVMKSFLTKTGFRKSAGERNVNTNNDIELASYGGGRCRGGACCAKPCCDEPCCDDACCGDTCCGDTCCGGDEQCCDAGCCADSCCGGGCCTEGGCDSAYCSDDGCCSGGGQGGCNNGGQDGCSACGGRGCGICQRMVGRIACGCGPHSGGYPEQYNFNPSPPSGQVAYPYYTVRGPRDFLRNNPPSIGPY